MMIMMMMMIRPIIIIIKREDGHGELTPFPTGWVANRLLILIVFANWDGWSREESVFRRVFALID